MDCDDIMILIMVLVAIGFAITMGVIIYQSGYQPIWELV